jgi:dTDP-4-amino-4,6-dideoxygalactose transaminase
MRQSIPLLDLQAQYAPIRQEIEEAIHRVVESQRFILGPEVESLESEIANYSQCQYAVGVSSGTDALLAALMAIDLKPGDEVITTPYSFFATAGAVARLGGIPVFVDINPDTYNIEAEQIESRLSARTRAIIPVHLFGQMADMETIVQLGRSHNIAIIEDAAQAIGAEHHGQRAGSLGTMGCFSFFPSKNLGGFGDGGMVVTNDPTLSDRLRLLRSHGFRAKYKNELLGGNFRLDAIQAAVLRVKLRHLDDWTKGRQRNAALYRDHLKRANVQLPLELPHVRHIYNQFVIRSGRRDELMTRLKENEIGCEVYYPSPLHLQSCFDHLGYQSGSFLASELAATQSLAIPIYPELKPDAIKTVADVIAAAS